MTTATAVATEWHDNGTRFTVPAGEPVEVITTSSIPDWIDRETISTGIKQYKKMGREFVAIKIRDWYALIELKKLSGNNTTKGK